MSLTTLPNSLVARLNAADPNTLADLLRALGFGTILRQSDAIALRRQNPSGAPANSYNLSTLQVLTLPDDAKARQVSRCYARAQSASSSTGSLGELTNKGPNITPTTNTFAVTPSGDIAFLATDDFSDVDLEYVPQIQDVVELTLGVASGILTIPAAYAGAAAPGAGKGPGVLMLMEAQALVGSVTGQMVVLAPGSAPGSSAQANLSANKMQVLFHVADAVTSARVKLGVCSAIDKNALLEAASPTF